MFLAESYSELCEQIKALEVRIEELEKERKLLQRRMFDNAPGANLTVDYSKERVSGGQTPIQLNIVVERLNKIDDRLDQLYSFLEIKKDSRKKIDLILKSSEDIDQKVTVMRDIKMMSLYEIAQELGYSVGHIKRISSRNQKMRLS